jgi:hypothetical protein
MTMPTFTTSREATKDEMAREIDRCHKVIAELEAALAERVPDREAVARALYPMLVHGGDYDEVPVDEAFTRPRYQHLAERANAAADAAIAAMQETKL